MPEISYDTIIIGGGPGGLSAGIYAKRAALNVMLIEKGVPGGQIVNSDEVENYLGFEHIGGAELSMKFSQHAQSYDLEVLSQEVAEIIPGVDFHTVKLANGDTLKTCSIIMAMGGNPRKLNIPGESEYYGKGVSYCAVCDGFFFRDKTVMVIGGGDTAVQESNYLTKFAKKVYLIHRRDELRATKILQERAMANDKIEIGLFEGKKNWGKVEFVFEPLRCESPLSFANPVLSRIPPFFRMAGFLLLFTGFSSLLFLHLLFRSPKNSGIKNIH